MSQENPQIEESEEIDTKRGQIRKFLDEVKSLQKSTSLIFFKKESRNVQAPYRQVL